MAYLQENQINEVRSAANIVDIISSYIPLTLKGKNYFGVCPFHDDHSPSMSVSSEKQIYKCFSCPAGGNVFNFVSEYENVSFVEAVQIVAQKVGISLNIKTNNDDNKNKAYYDLMALSSKVMMTNLKTAEGLKAQEYLAKRGINKEIINDFNIGLSLKDNSLYQVLRSKGYTDDQLYATGLINYYNNEIIDTFKERIVFPLYNPQGQIVGFSGRIYLSSEGAKYINSKETPIFKKGECLYNYHRAKESVKSLKEIIVVEGYMDAISLYTNGISNVVAIMGTSLTKEQISLIQKLRCKVLLCLDNDQAGNTAMLSIGETLTANDMDVKIVKYADYKDPDEYIKSAGLSAFKNCIKQAKSFFDFKKEAIRNKINVNNPEELTKYLDVLLKDVAQIKDELLKTTTINQIAKDYDIRVELLLQRLGKSSVTKKIVEKKRPVLKQNKFTEVSENVLYWLMTDYRYLKKFKNKIGYFKDSIYRELYNEILYYYEYNKDITLADFISSVNDNERLADIVKRIVNNNFESNEHQLNIAEDFDSYLDILQKENIKYEIQELKNKLKMEQDVNKKMAIAEEIAEIKKGSVENG